MPSSLYVKPRTHQFRCPNGQWRCGSCHTMRAKEDYVMWTKKWKTVKKPKCDSCMERQEQWHKLSRRWEKQEQWHKFSRRCPNGQRRCASCDTMNAKEDYVMWTIRFGKMKAKNPTCDSCMVKQELHDDFSQRDRQLYSGGHWRCGVFGNAKPRKDFSMWLLRSGAHRSRCHNKRCDSCTVKKRGEWWWNLTKR